MSEITETEAKPARSFADFGLKSSSEFPNICLLIAIMISTPSSILPIERAYSILEIVFANRRYRFTVSHIEMLFLLSVLKLDVWEIEDYLECLQYLESFVLFGNNVASLFFFLSCKDIEKL